MVPVEMWCLGVEKMKIVMHAPLLVRVSICERWVLHKKVKTI
jgi:hypothetical protein